MNINTLVQEAHEAAKAKGFYDGNGERNIGEALMLIVSEIGEAMEAHRKGNKYADSTTDEVALLETITMIGKNGNKRFAECFEGSVKDTFEDELADAVIRICDLCGHLGIDLQKHIELKMLYNETRPHKHGKEY